LRRAQRVSEEDVPEGEEVTDVSWKDQLLSVLLQMPTDGFE
jgi:hypothetical protein